MSRRLKLLRVNPDLLLYYFKDSLPEGTRVCGAGKGLDAWMYDAKHHEILIVIENEKFDEVKNTEMIPELDLKLNLS